MINDNRKPIVEKMVGNYMAQVRIVKSQGVKMTLGEYLEGIQKLSPTMTKEEIEYGLEFAGEEWR